MAQQDTGLGWSSESEYLIEGSQYIGQIVLSSFNPNTLHFNSAPTISEVINSGASFVSGGTVYYVAVWCRNGYTGGELEIALYRDPNDNVHYVNFVCFSDEILRMYYPAFFITDGTTLWRANYNYNNNATSPDPDTGLYTISCTNVYYSTLSFSSLSDGTAVTGTSLNDVETKKPKTITPCYKLNAGYSVTCFAKWVTPTGTVLISPVLISTHQGSTFISNDGVDPISNQVSVSFKYDGLTFYMTYLPEIDGSKAVANSSFVPVLDLTQFAAAAPSKVFALIASESFANILVNETVDPYAPFGNTEEGGGEVDPDPEDDDIEEPTLPGLSFAATGLCRIYRADLTALNQLANYMWTDNTFLQTLINHAIQLIENPMDAIISLCLVPVAPPSFSVGTAEAVSVMYIPTPAAMWPVINQFARVDCGTLNLEETYGSALDYNPYTKVSCFLPYIGFVDLDTDEVMGKTLNVVYRIDVVTGVCVAMIKVNGEVMYQFSGHCAIQMPLSSADFSTVISSLLQAGKLVAGAALTAAGAPEVGGMLLDAPQVSQPSTTVRKMVGTERNPNTGRQITTGTVTETVEKTGKPLALGELAKRQSANTVGAIMNSKFGIEHSGGFSGNSGYLGVRRPFIIVKRPRLANPEQYGQYNGRPSMIYLNLGTCTGYTEVQSIQLTGIAATNSELSEIATLLKTGVIL